MKVVLVKYENVDGRSWSSLTIFLQISPTSSQCPVNLPLFHHYCQQKKTICIFGVCVTKHRNAIMKMPMPGQLRCWIPFLPPFCLCCLQFAYWIRVADGSTLLKYSALHSSQLHTLASPCAPAPNSRQLRSHLYVRICDPTVTRLSHRSVCTTALDLHPCSRSDSE